MSVPDIIRRGRHAVPVVPWWEIGARGGAHIVSISGGKDSLATYLLAMLSGLPFEAVFADTGNEHAWTYDYVQALPALAGGPPIRTVRQSFAAEIAQKRVYVQEAWPNKGVPAAIIERALEALHPTGNPYLDLCLWKGRFPARRAQFCTQELKGRPISEQVYRRHHDAGRLIFSWQGVRRDESFARRDVSDLQRVNDIFDPLEREYMVYRPLAGATEAWARSLARKLNVPQNPLYAAGANRVGCWPCINCSKDELRLFADLHPEHVERLEQWEWCVGQASKRGVTTFFNIVNDPVMEAEFRHQRALDGGDPLWRPETHGIRRMIEWSRTERGGRQFGLFGKTGPGDEICSLVGACE